jgi:predicted AAA+ superfamily ATPase
MLIIIIFNRREGLGMYLRKLNISKLMEKKSFFLFGARSTGKSTLIAMQLPSAKVYDLLDAEVYSRLLKRPKILEEENQDPSQIIVIDEIQKIPHLLDEVHRLIQGKNLRFLLTGSSARKLKHGGANLLAGRAWVAALYPLSFIEIPEFDLLRYLNRGGLPHVYGSEDAQEELRSYVGTYLREEIQAEAAVRQISAFSEFLDLVALSNGQEINYESFASDCQVSPSTLKNYLQVLEDTLIGFRLPGYTKTVKRKAISRAKHYLFDIGVTNSLCRRGHIAERTELFGDAFEHFIILEVRAFLSYTRNVKTMSYWRSTSKFEVDIIIEDEIAIEIKATNLVSNKHLKGLRALQEEGIHRRYIVVSTDPSLRKTAENIEIYPWKLFLQQLWGGEIIFPG